MKKFSKGFSFTELTSNSNSKTSASGVAGLLIVLIGALSFITGVLLIVAERDQQDLLIQSIAIIYAGAALLGVRKMRNTRPYYNDNYEQPVHGGDGLDSELSSSDEPR